jgi:hypothetical protein
MKPVVHYTDLAYIKVSGVAVLLPLDHPNHLPTHNVSNKHHIRTSTVLRHDVETGEIETMNTIYRPLKVD